MVSNDNENQQVVEQYDPATGPVVQPGVAEKNLKKAIVTLPNGDQRKFFIHKNAKGKILSDLVAESQALLEKDYFGLRYTDEFGEKSWLYPDKKINRQLKQLEWNFTFQVKFYPPEPSVLADDLTRYLLYLQVRNEIYESKLPASYPIQVLLAAIVMQAETGDFETTQQSPQEYDAFIRSSRIVPSIDDEFLQKVREAHKEQKGLTTQEAHQKYLDTAKKLAKYGFTFFQGKDAKNGTVSIGIYAHGICIYKDQVQIHRFLWQAIVKILFRGSRFTVVLKEGELDDKKVVSVHYKMPDYNTAKRVYRTAVEHHTFFRLIKPEDKPKAGLLRRWGSDKFRYQGRTYFQAKMASQMFDSPLTTTVQRTPSGRQVSRSVDDLAHQRSFPTSPLHYADETTQQVSSPEKSKSYSLKMTKEERAKQKAAELHIDVTADDGSAAARSRSESRESLVSPMSGEYVIKPYSPRDESMTSPYEYPMGLTSEERRDIYTTPTKSQTKSRSKKTVQSPATASDSARLSRVRFVDESAQARNGHGQGSLTPDDGSAVAIAPAAKPGKRVQTRRQFGPVNDDHTTFSPVNDLYRNPEMGACQIGGLVAVYHKGHYVGRVGVDSDETMVKGARRQTLVNHLVCCKPQNSYISKKIKEMKLQGELENFVYPLNKKMEVDFYPIRYYVGVYHSGRPEVETKKSKKWWKARSRDEETVEQNLINLDNYSFPKDTVFDNVDRLECSRDPDALALRQYSNVYWYSGNSKPGAAAQDIPRELRETPEQAEIRKVIQVIEKRLEERPGEEREVLHEVETSEKPEIIEEGNERIVRTKTTTTVTTTTRTVHEGQEVVSEAPDSDKHVIKHTMIKEKPTVASFKTSTAPQETESAETQQLTSILREPPTVTTVDVTRKDEEIDQLPIKKFANIYHSGQSVEASTPIEWVRRQKAILFLKKRFNSSTTTATSTTTEHSEKPSTSGEPVESESTSRQKSSVKLVLGKRKERNYSMSENYPVLAEPFVGELEEIQKASEAPSADLFDCVEFASDVPAAEAQVEPVTKKAKYSRAARLCLWCGPGARLQKSPEDREEGQVVEEKDEDEYRYHLDKTPYTGELSSLEKENEAESVKILEVVNYQDSETGEPGSVRLDSELHKIVPEVFIRKESIKKFREGYPMGGQRYSGPLEELERQGEVEKESIRTHVQNIPEGVSFRHAHKDKKSSPKRRESGEAIEKVVEITAFKHAERSRTHSRDYPEVGQAFIGDIDELKRGLETRTEVLTQETAFQKIQEEEDSGRRDSTSPKSRDSQIVDEKRARRGYPEITAPFEGLVLNLERQQEAPQGDIFESVHFEEETVSSPASEEPEIVQKTKKTAILHTKKRENDQDDVFQVEKKPKKSLFGFLSKKKHERAGSEESLESIKGTVQEKIVARRRQTKKSRLYSTSRHYPEIGDQFEGQLAELAPEKQAETANLFDCVDFDSDEDEDKYRLKKKHSVDKKTVTEVESKPSTSSKDWSLMCGPFAKKQPKRVGSEESLKSTKGTVQEQIVARRRVLRRSRFHSTSKNYPEIGQKLEGKVEELAPEKQAETANLFDVVDFDRDEDVFPVDVVEEKKVKKSKPQKRSRKRSALYSMSENYPEIGDKYDGELKELSPSTEIASANLFDTISFASTSSEDSEIEHDKKAKSKSKGLWCGPLLTRSKRKASTTSSTSTEQVVPAVRERKQTRTYSLSQHYPQTSEIHEGPLHELAPKTDIESANLFEHVDFVKDQQPAKTDLVKGVEAIARTEEPKPSTSKDWSLMCGPLGKKHRKRADSDVFEEDTAPVVRKRVRTKTYSLSKDYPGLTEVHTGELAELAPTTEAQSTNLFDCVNFLPDQTHVAAERAEKTEKIQVTKIKETTAKATHSQRKRTRSLLYSMSENYPEIGDKFEGELKELSPSTEIASANLFDTISFDSDPEDDKFRLKKKKAIKEEKPKEPRAPSKDWSLMCSPFAKKQPKRVGSEESLESTKGTVHEQIVARRRVLRRSRFHSTSKNYPEIGQKVEGKVEELAPEKQAETANLFDVVDFDRDEDVFPVDVVEEKKVKKSKPRKRSRTRSALYSMSENYPEIGDKFEGELHKLAPSTEIASANLFDTISFDSDPEEDDKFRLKKKNKKTVKEVKPKDSEQPSTSKDWSLMCGPLGKKHKKRADSDVFEEDTAPVVRERIRTRTYSLSKNYPALTEVHTGELAEMAPTTEAQSANLFECVDFVREADPIPQIKIERVDTSQAFSIESSKFKPRKEKLNLFCTKVPRVDGSMLTINTIQPPRDKKKIHFKRGRFFSMSENYPEIGQKYEGEVQEIKHVKDVESANLFDWIDFVSDQGSVKSGEIKKTGGSNFALSCLQCGLPKSTKSRKGTDYPEVTEPYEGDVYELASGPEVGSEEFSKHVQIQKSLEKVVSEVPTSPEKPLKTKVKGIVTLKRKSHPDEEERVVQDEITVVQEQLISPESRIKTTEQVHVTRVVRDNYPEYHEYTGDYEDLRRNSEVQSGQIQDTVSFETSQKRDSKLQTIRVETTDNRGFPLIGQIYDGHVEDLTVSPDLEATVYQPVAEPTVEVVVEEEGVQESASKSSDEFSGYPLRSEPYLGDLESLHQNPEIETSKLFETINFRESDDSEIPGSYKLNSRLRSIKKKNVAMAETVEILNKPVVPEGYPQITDRYTGFLDELQRAPEAATADFFDVISFDSSADVKKEKKTFSKLLFPALLCAHPQKTGKKDKLKGYPEITSPFEGELFEINRVEDAPSADLFDCISFASAEPVADERIIVRSSSEDSGIEEDKRPKKTGLWCGPGFTKSKSKKRVERESSEKEIVPMPRARTQTRTYSLSKDYPEVTEVHEGHVHELAVQKEAQSANLFDCVDFASEEEEKKKAEVVKPVESKPSTSKDWSLMCGPLGKKHRKRADSDVFEEDTAPVVRERVQTRTYSLSKDYPGLTEVHTGELAELAPTTEAQSANLFDHVNFQPVQTPVVSEKIEKTEKTQVKKIKETTAKATHSQRKRTRSLLYSMSENYPEIGEKFEGELKELSPSAEISSANLFDTISFDSDPEEDKFRLNKKKAAKEEKPKEPKTTSSKDWSLMCGPFAKKQSKRVGSEESLESTKGTVHEQIVARRRVLRRSRFHSTSKNYPEIGQKVEGKLEELAPEKQAETANLFDVVDFDRDEEEENPFKAKKRTKRIDVNFEKKEKEERAQRSPSKFGLCAPLLLVARPKQSKYPEITEPYTGELSELSRNQEAPSADLFDVISFASVDVPQNVNGDLLHEESPAVVAVVEQIHQQAEREDHPVVAEIQVDELTVVREFEQVQQRESVETTPEVEEFAVQKTSQRKKKGKLHLKRQEVHVSDFVESVEHALIEKSKKSESVEPEEVDIPVPGTPLPSLELQPSEFAEVIQQQKEPQIATETLQKQPSKRPFFQRFVKKSGKYPEITTPFEGELSEMVPAKEADSADLFENVHFLPREIPVEAAVIQTKDADEDEDVFPVDVVEQKKVKKSKPPKRSRTRSVLYSMSENYPEIGERFEGELHELAPSTEIASANLFDTISFDSDPEEDDKFRLKKKNNKTVKEVKPKDSEQPSTSKDWSLMCGPLGKKHRKRTDSDVFEEAVAPVVRERIRTRTYSLSKDYPGFTEAHTGELAELAPTNEAQSANLFDCVNFLPDQTPVAAERVEKTEKIQVKKIKEATAKATHSQRKRTRSLLYSMSENYPEIGEKFEGELQALAPSTEIASANLFDTISFDSDPEDDKFRLKKKKAVKEEKPKEPKTTSSKDWSLMCGPFVKKQPKRVGSEESLKSTKGTVQEQIVARRRVLRRSRFHSTSKNYPEIGQKVEGKLEELAPEKQAETANLFDVVDFDRDEDVFPVDVVEEKKVKKSKPQKRSRTRSALYSMSENYPEIGNKYDGELQELAPSTEMASANLFDCVDFSTETEEEPTVGTLKLEKSTRKRVLPVCLPCISRQNRRKQDIEHHDHPLDEEPYEIKIHVHEPTPIPEMAEIPKEVLERTEITQVVTESRMGPLEEDETTVIRTTVETVVKRSVVPMGYPEIGEQFTGDLSELSRHPEAGSGILTETVTFSNDPEHPGSFKTDEDLKLVGYKKKSPEKIPKTPKGYPQRSEQFTGPIQDLSRNLDPENQNLSESIETVPDVTLVSRPRAQTPPQTVTPSPVPIIVEEVASPTHSEPFEEVYEELHKRQEAEPAPLTRVVEEVRSHEAAFDAEQQVIAGPAAPESQKKKRFVIKGFRKEKKIELVGYPEISGPTEGSIQDLEKSRDVEDSNLFDNVKFTSDSDDSGVGADSGVKPSSKFGLWCGPGFQKSKSKKRVERESSEKEVVPMPRARTQTKTYSLSKDYPGLTEVHTGELAELAPTTEAQSANLFDCVNFLPDQSPVAAERVEKTEKIQVKKIKEKTAKATHSQRKRTRSLLYSMSENYPEIGEKFEGELKELSPSTEIPSANLFDIVDFASEEQDQPRPVKPKQKKTKQLNLFCTKMPRTTSEESLASVKGTVHEKIMDRRRVIKKPQLYSISEYYPGMEEPFTGELSELAPEKQAESANLFDYVDFDSNDEEDDKYRIKKTKKIVEKEEKSAKQKASTSSKDWSLMCGPFAKKLPKRVGSEESLESTKGTVQEQIVARRRVLRRSRFHSTSKNYPEIGQNVEGKLEELAPEKQAETANLFDVVDFDRDEDVFPVDVVEEKKVKKSKPQKRSRTRSALYSMSENYPEIGDKYDGELNELSPSTEIASANLFDTISFDSDPEEDKFRLKKKNKKVVKEVKPKDSEQPSTLKDWYLMCGPLGKKHRKRADSDVFEEDTAPVVRERTRTRTYSLSKDYPALTEVHTGELAELAPTTEAQSANLFDCVNFLPDQTPVAAERVEKTEKVQVKKIKETTAKATHSQRKRTRSLLYSMSENYPEIGNKFEGELQDLAPSTEIASANLFDTISFDSDPEEDKFRLKKKTKKASKPTPSEPQQPPQKKEKLNLFCTTIPREEESESEDEQPVVAPVKKTRYYPLSENYPQITEVFTGEVVDLAPQKQAETADLFESVQFAPREDLQKMDKVEPLKISIPTSESRHSQVNKLLWCSPASKSAKLEGYPVQTEPYSGELSELASTPEAPAISLIDVVSFKSKDGSKQQKAQSPVSQQSTRKTVWALKAKSVSLEGYPTIQEPFIGDVYELVRIPEAENADLFKCVQFAEEEAVKESPKMVVPVATAEEKSPEKLSKRKLRLFGRKRLSKTGSGLDLRSYPKMELFDGELTQFGRENELSNQDLRQVITVYHSGYSVPLGKKRFERVRHEGLEEVLDKPSEYPHPEFDFESAEPIYPFKFETVALRAYGRLPVMSQMEQPARTPKELRKKRSKSVSTVRSEVSSTTSDSGSVSDVGKLQQRDSRTRTEGILSFFRNRLGSKSFNKKKTGFENLVEPYSGEVILTQKDRSLQDQPLLDHVRVYHNGFSTQQAIDSGFEEGPVLSADESKKVGTLHLKKGAKSKFLDKFKLSTKENPETPKIEETIHELPSPSTSTAYPDLDTAPYLGLYDTVSPGSEFEHSPLNTAVDTVPRAYYYEKRPQTTSPVPASPPPPSESGRLQYPSTEKYSGELEDVIKNPDVLDLPIGEHVTVYHCGKSDIKTPEVPKEIFEDIKEIPQPDSSRKTKKTGVLHLKKARGYPSFEEYSGPLADLEKKDDVQEESMQVHVNVYHSGVSGTQTGPQQVKEEKSVQKAPEITVDAPTKEKEDVMVEEFVGDSDDISWYHKIIFLVRKPVDLKDYPEKSEYSGDLFELMKMTDVEDLPLNSQVRVYHPGTSFVSRKRTMSFLPGILTKRRRRLFVNYNDYPRDASPVLDTIHDLESTKDMPESESPVSIEKSLFYGPSGPAKKRRGILTLRRSRRENDQEYSKISVEGNNRRDDNSRTNFSTIITDKSLFVSGHWPVTDIDCDLILKTERKIDCEVEAFLVPQTFQNQGILVRETLNPSGPSFDGSISQKNDGTWHASASFTVCPKKAESTTQEVERTRNCQPDIISTLDLDLEFEELVEDDVEDMNLDPNAYTNGKPSSMLKGLISPSVWRKKLTPNRDHHNVMSVSVNSHFSGTENGNSGIISTIRRRLSEKLAKKERKKDEKRKKQEEKELKKKAKHGKKEKTGRDVSSSSSSSSESHSDAEIEERHVVISQAISGPVDTLKKNRELGDISNRLEEDKHYRKPMAPQNSVGAAHIDPNSSGPYTPAKANDGRVIREETIEQVYRISGTGNAPKFDPNDMSLKSTVNKYMEEADKAPRVQMVEANILVKEQQPVPQALKEGSAPHTTVHTWHETEAGPETVVTEVDKYGNKVTKTIKTQHTKHTVQKQTYQTYALDENKPEQTIEKTSETHTPLNNASLTRSPVVNTHTRTVAYEKGQEPDRGDGPVGELVSTKTITTGNRTVEILTYKTEKDGVIETRVEHRVTIHSGSDVDHDAELAKALLEATQLSPDLVINRVEVQKTSQH